MIVEKRWRRFFTSPSTIGFKSSGHSWFKVSQTPCSRNKWQDYRVFGPLPQYVKVPLSDRKSRIVQNNKQKSKPLCYPLHKGGRAVPHNHDSIKLVVLYKQLPPEIPTNPAINGSAMMHRLITAEKHTQRHTCRTGGLACLYTNLASSLQTVQMSAPTYLFANMLNFAVTTFHMANQKPDTRVQMLHSY